MELVCAVDLGTTRTKAALVDARGTTVRVAWLPASDLAAGGGGVELDAAARAADVVRLLRELRERAGASAGQVAALCIASQRATVVPLSARGEPVGPGISWQDTRGQEAMAKLAARLGAERFVRVTGLPPSFLWTVAKILWYREALPDACPQVRRWGLLPDFVLHALGAGDVTTDYSNASVTGLLDLRGREWSEEILAAAGLSRGMLPGLVLAGRVAGRLSEAVARETGLAAGMPLVMGGGDQQCAALGLSVTEPGQGGLCLGTAAVLSCPAAAVPPVPEGYFCTVHVVPGRFVREGIFNSFGSSFEWAVQALELESAADLDAAAAESGAGAGGVRFFPYLAGIGSPEFDGRVRGAFVGLDLSTKRSDLARAVVEGVAFECRRVLDSVDPGGEVEELVVSGGGAASPLLAQVLADVTGRALAVRGTGESTLSGAAMLAWTGVGRFGDVLEAARAWGAGEERRLGPSPAARKMQALYAQYRRWVALLQEGAAPEARA